MWLDKLKEIKEKANMSIKDIALKTGFNEKTIARIFSGETDNPYISTLIPITNALGCSLDDIFADTKVVVGTEKLSTLQDELASKDFEITMLKNKNNVLIAKNDILELTLKHKEEELKAIFEYYHKLSRDE